MELENGSDLVGTAQHPIWSESRDAWTPLGELLPGEQLRGRSGSLAVLAVVPLPGTADVYNLEVHGQHVYDITPAGVLVHNATECGPYRGGRHAQMRKPARDGLHSHHMPADSVNGLSKNEGPAIQMDPLDHARTASHGSQAGHSVYRLRQERLVRQGKFGAAIQMDIDNIRQLFGTKYDGAIQQMIESLDPWMKKGLGG